MLDRNKYALLGTALFITFPLIIFGVRAKYLVAVAFQPKSETDAQILCKDTLTEVDGAGIAHLDFCVLLPSSNAPLFLEVRPVPEGRYYRQEGEYKTARGTACGVMRLGSQQWPLHQNEEYAFRLVDQKGATTLDGTIIARVHSVAGVPHWVLLAIGVLASVLQILAAFRRREPPNAGPRSRTNSP